MATNFSRHDIGAGRSGTSIGTTAFLLGIYTAFYLAVVGVVHFMSSPDATAAITPAPTQQHAAAPNVPPEAIGATRDATTAYFDEPGMAETDNSRECTPDAGVDSECVFN